MIIEEGSAWKMAVRENYLNLVRRITPYMEFSKSLMETLAVVAWKQPIIQSDVIKVRTNKAYEHIDELEKMGFLAREKHGRSFLLKLSQKFYDYFDLRNDVDVKNLFKHIKDEGPEQKKVDEFVEAPNNDLKVEDEATGEVDDGQKRDVTIETDVPKVREQDALPAKKAAKK
jgi:segregation and condensation protein B